VKFRPDASAVIAGLRLSLIALAQANDNHKTVDDTVAMGELFRDVEALAGRAAAELELMAAQDRASERRAAN